MKTMLAIVFLLLTPNLKAANPYGMSDWHVVQFTLLMECRGEPFDGQRQAAQTIVRRSKKYGISMAAACLMKKQYSCWNKIPSYEYLTKLSKNDKTWNRLGAITNLMFQGKDPYPENPNIEFYHGLSVSPKWTYDLKLIGVNGGHAFYQEKI